MKTSSENYKANIFVDAPEKVAYDSICRVPEWWGSESTGPTRNLGDEFIYHFGDTG